MSQFATKVTGAGLQSQYSRSYSSPKRYYDKSNFSNAPRQSNEASKCTRSSPVLAQSKDRKQETKKAKGQSKSPVRQIDDSQCVAANTTKEANNSKSYDSNGYNNRHSFYQRKNVYFARPNPMKRFYHIAEDMTCSEKPKNLLNGTTWDKLSSDMWNLYSARKQDHKLFISKIRIWERLFNQIRDYEPSYGLYLVGSTVNGFGINGSDIDLCLMLHNTEVDQSIEAPKYLNKVRELASRSPDLIKDADVIYAKVPLLKFRDPKTNLNIDMNVNNCVGIRNTHLLHCYSQLDWRVKPLGLLVKEWARRHNINDARSMTLSSYSLTLMVINYLQCAVSPPVLPCLQEMYKDKFNPTNKINKINSLERMKPYQSENTQTLGELFLGFFQYYAQFNFYENVISVRKGTTLPFEECQMAPHPKNNPSQWKCIGVEEPFDRSNAARAVFDVYKFENVICPAIRHTADVLGRTLDLASAMNPTDLYTPYHHQTYKM
ncbi:Poly(A) RNA polymerase gld-2 [Nesidiocoris tenuis]|nr:Poly(A) RNA polymerase gld-2 [Nesidiocoris tenuis]